MLLDEVEKLIREKVKDSEALAASLELLDRLRQLPPEVLVALAMKPKTLAATLLWIAVPGITKAQAAHLFKASQATISNKAWIVRKLLNVSKKPHRRGDRIIKTSGGLAWPLPQELVEGWGLEPGWHVEWEITGELEVKLKFKPPPKL